MSEIETHLAVEPRMSETDKRKKNQNKNIATQFNTLEAILNEFSVRRLEENESKLL